MHVAIAFVNIGTYHRARLRAASAACAQRGWRLTAIQVTDDELDHPWGSTQERESYELRTLLPTSERGAKVREAFSLAAAKAMARCLDDMRPDAVLLPGWSHPAAESGRYWCLENGALPILMSESTRDDFDRVWWREAYKALLVRSHVAAVVGGTPHRDYLTTLGMDPSVIYLGYDTVDNDYFATGADGARGQAENVRRELKLPANYFLASSRFIEKKNLRGLITGFARYAHTQRAAWSLVILGEGELRPTLERLALELDVGPLVHMPGFSGYDILPKYYGLANAFVHASTIEQWGLVVNEAMAAGLPVLVSKRCGCAKDLVEPGANGFLFDPFDVEQLAASLGELSSASEESLRAMGRRSAAKIREWGPDRFGQSVISAVDIAASRRLRARESRRGQLMRISTHFIARVLAMRSRP